jgi:hypothetical protein
MLDPALHLSVDQVEGSVDVGCARLFAKFRSWLDLSEGLGSNLRQIQFDC